MLSVLAGRSKDVFETVLAAGRIQNLSEEFSMIVGKTGELDTEAESFEQVGHSTGELFRLAVPGRDVQRKLFTYRYLGDGVDVAAADANIADTSRASARGKFQLDLFKV